MNPEIDKGRTSKFNFCESAFASSYKELNYSDTTYQHWRGVKEADL